MKANRRARIAKGQESKAKKKVCVVCVSAFKAFKAETWAAQRTHIQLEVIH